MEGTGAGNSPPFTAHVQSRRQSLDSGKVHDGRRKSEEGSLHANSSSIRSSPKKPMKNMALISGVSGFSCASTNSSSVTR